MLTNISRFSGSKQGQSSSSQSVSGVQVPDSPFAEKEKERANPNATTITDIKGVSLDEREIPQQSNLKTT